MISKFLITRIIVFITIILIGGFAGQSVQAADLKIKTTKSTYQVGDTISVKIILSSTDQPANALSGTLIFPSDKLTVSSLNKNNSLINIWIQEPSFSNPNGQVLFEGAILNPGYLGSTGQILTVVFKAKKAGAVNLAFSRGSILASDGQGTAILNKLGQANFSITTTNIVPVPVAKPISPPPSSTIPLPQITSPTNPLDTWSNHRRPQFVWDLPTEITGAVFALDDKPETDSVTKFLTLADSLSTYTSIEDLADGQWYFHLRFKKRSNFGPVATYAVKIDTTPPVGLFINEIKQTGQLASASFNLSATDQLSGLANYLLQIDGGVEQMIDGSIRVWQTPKLKAGSHRLLVRAIDRAGNSSELETSFIITTTWWFGWLDYLKVWPRLIIIFFSFLALILVIILFKLIISWRRQPTALNPSFGSVSFKPDPSIYNPPITSTPPVTSPATSLPASPAEALVIFSGRAYPANDVSVILADQVLAKTRTGLDGRFEISLNHLPVGDYNFSLRAFDPITRQTASQIFPMTLTAGITIRTTDIFLVPPYPTSYQNNQNVS